MRYKVAISKDDECYKCRHNSKKKPCPLLYALDHDLVTWIDEELSMGGCAWFQEKNVKAVEDDDHLRGGLGE